MSNSDLDPASTLYKEIVDNLEDGVYVVDGSHGITYWNKGAERLTGYAAQEVLGRRCSDNLLIHVNESGEPLCLTGCPLTEAMADGKPREAQIYLHHRDGHRVPVRVCASPVRNEAGVIVGAVETFADVSGKVAIEQQIDSLRKMAMLDELTGLANRRYMEMVLRSRLEEHQRYGWPLGIVFVDIDRFKSINDTFGHATGDRVLRIVARTLAAISRSFDIVGRFGGEEFVAVLVNVDSDHVVQIADRYRRLVQESKLAVDGREVAVTVSIGATLATNEDTMDSLMARADQLMYRSKDGGRNRVSTDVK